MRYNSLYSAQPARTSVPRDSGPDDGLRYRPAAVAQVDQVAPEVVRDDDHVPAALQRQPLIELQQEPWVASSEAALRRGGSQRRAVDARQLARQHHRLPHKLRRSQFLHGVLRATVDRSQGSDLLTKASRSNQRSSFLSLPLPFCRGCKHVYDVVSRFIVITVRSRDSINIWNSDLPLANVDGYTWRV